MSWALLDGDSDYLHSPVDDLESFFWVAVWSVLFNEDNAKGQSDKEKRIKDDFIRHHEADAIDSCYSVLAPDAKASDITRCFRTILLKWWKKVRDQNEMWVEKVLGGRPKDAGGEYYLPHFHRYALQGVVDVLEVLVDHWDKEIGWESWAPSA